MGLDQNIQLPCNTTTGICDCTTNMDKIIMNSTNYKSENIYMCGYFNGINSFGTNQTVSIIFPEPNSSDIKGWSCGAHTSKLYNTSSDYSMLNLYRCGFNAGKTMGRNFKNGGVSMKDVKTNLLVFLLFFVIKTFFA
ncbi:hypothetical protein MOUN0_O00342 [Monosporozyma unispora]|nr:hypothetical protein C6P44_001902 [Kazachstania unispora]